MNFSIEEFDTLMAQAEDAAAGFDARAIQMAMGALNTYMDGVVAHCSDDESLLNHVRLRLQRYQRLCTFLQQTLHQVLVGALQAQGHQGYKPHGYISLAAPRGAQQSHIAPLIRRYC